jgi:hypothetical protein
MQHVEGSGTPVLYIGRTVLKGKHLPKSYSVRSYTLSAYHQLPFPPVMPEDKLS